MSHVTYTTDTYFTSLAVVSYDPEIHFGKVQQALTTITQKSNIVT